MQGIISAVPTMFDAAGEIQKDPFIEHCKWLLENGCDGLNILGSTGEANSISNADRKTIMRWAAEGLDKTRLMVGTGTPCLEETIELTQHANALGISVALVLPPYYYKPVSDAGLIAWYSALDAALSELPIQIYFYNFPQMTGIKIPVSVIAELSRRFPSRFTGIKDSSGDLDYCREILAILPNLAVFPSSETSLSEAHQSGFAGCISATVNITASLCARVWANREKPDPELINEITRQRNAISNAGLIPAIKHLVSNRTGNAEWRNILPPFLALDNNKANHLEQEIKK